MSDAKLNLRAELWDSVLSEEPLPAVKKAVEAHLTAFDRHKDTLLDDLRKCSGPKSQSFDANKWWGRLTQLALVYFLQQGMASPRERVARLRKLAEVLDRARALAKKAAQDDLGCDDLLSTMFRGALPRDPGGTLVRNPDGSYRAVYFAEIGGLKQIAENLDIYQAAVLRAADDVPAAGPGKPVILPRAYIHALADVYRGSTGRKPGLGRGPFAQFAMKFRGAVDPSYKTKDENGCERVDYSLIEAIKSAGREDGWL
jgi:hypothetical protein